MIPRPVVEVKGSHLCCCKFVEESGITHILKRMSTLRQTVSTKEVTASSFPDVPFSKSFFLNPACTKFLVRSKKVKTSYLPSIPRCSTWAELATKREAWSKIINGITVIIKSQIIRGMLINILCLSFGIF